MKRCEACRVEYSGDLGKCPLCGGKLTGEAEPSPFPPNKVKVAGAFALTLLAMLTAAAFIAVLYLGDGLGLSRAAMAVGCAGVALNYLFVRNIIKHSPAFLRSVVRYFLLLLAICAVWYLFTGDPDVVTFLVPGVCLVSIVFDVVLVLAFRDSFVFDYAKYLLFNIVLGVIPLALSAGGLTTKDAPSQASATAAVVLAVVLAVFARKQILAEIRKLFSA